MPQRIVGWDDRPLIDLDEVEQAAFWDTRWDEDPETAEEADPTWLGGATLGSAISVEPARTRLGPAD